MVVYVTKKLASQQEELARIVNSLGGEFKLHYDAGSVTHVIFTGKTNDLTKEFRMAKKVNLLKE